MSVAVVVLLVAVAVLVLLLREYRCRVRALEARVARLRGATGLADVGADGVTPLISVEILNGQELAARESWAARRFGSLVPRYVGREVAARAAAQMAEQLAQEGVRAEVRIGAPAPVDDAEPRPTGEAVAAGVRDAHLTVSAIPFDLLDGLPPARAVRTVHDRITVGVYDAVTAVSRAVTGRR